MAASRPAAASPVLREHRTLRPPRRSRRIQDHRRILFVDLGRRPGRRVVEQRCELRRYGLLWTVFLTTPFMIAIQLVSAQIGRLTGKGIIANVKDFAPRWLVIALVSMLVMANTFNIAADLAAMGEALSLVIGGLNHEHALIFAATSVLLQVFVLYRR